MKIKLDGGFIEAQRDSKGNISIVIASENFSIDGTRKDTVVNSASLSEKEIVHLFSDIFDTKGVEPGSEQS